jgi:hypothetical protein
MYTDGTLKHYVNIRTKINEYREKEIKVPLPEKLMTSSITYLLLNVKIYTILFPVKSQAISIHFSQKLK